MTEALCYNRGCQKTYIVEKSVEDSCLYHPGVPVFHDAYKSWSCCNKKTTDFHEFLNIKGCTSGPHSNVKPPEPEKPVKETTAPPPVEELRSPVYERAERPSASQPKVVLKSSVNANLAKLLEQMQVSTPNAVVAGDNNVIAVGTSCKHKGCTSSYSGTSSDSETCVYHSGEAIFHEGMKVWTCCQRKTSDFNAFLEQVGCEEGEHLWIAPSASNLDKSKTCRYDWHQTASHVTLVVYSKNPIPAESKIEANNIQLSVKVTFGNDRKEFENVFDLFGIIDLDESSVTYYSTKLEIQMRKAEPISWIRLTVPSSERT